MRLFERPKPQMGTQREVLDRRVAAVLVDAVVVLVLAAALAFVLGRSPYVLAGVVAAVAFGYAVYFEGTYGQTLGKRAMNLVVVNRRGYPCTYEAAAVRAALRIVDALLGAFVVGYVAIALTDDGQRLGDLAADTVVVRSREYGAQL